VRAVPSPERFSVSTRKLILLAMVAGMAILVAFALQVSLMGR